MIEVNLSNAVEKSKLMKYQTQVANISSKIANYELEGNDFLGWIDLPTNQDKIILKKMENYALELKNRGIEILVVIGIGGSYLGAKAGYDFLAGLHSKPPGLELLFAGESVSGIDIAEKLAYVANKKFAINVISKSGKTVEPALAFRVFYSLLQKQTSNDEADKLVFVTTDANKGNLLKQARQKNWTRFIIPDNVGGRFSVLTPVGLFPLVCAGFKIREILEGAREGKKLYSTPKLKHNVAYQYAVARYILGQTLKTELFVSYEPKLANFAEWWKQLFGESEGKLGRGIFPASATFSRDLHSLGQFIQDGTKNLFETVLTIEEPSLDIKLFTAQDNIDGLNFLANKTMHDINKIFFKSVTHAHVSVGKVPNIVLEIETDDAYHFGLLVYFFERAVTMSAYLIGVNPFNQPGVEVYKTNMLKELEALREENDSNF